MKRQPFFARLGLLGLVALATLPASNAQAARKDAPAVAPRADFTGKPVGPFGFRYEIAGEPRLGEPLEVRISLSPEAALDNVTLTLSGPAALVIDTPLLGAPRIEPGVPQHFIVTVTPFAPTVLDLRVVVEADLGGLRQAHGELIPIRLGAAKAPARANLEPDPDDPGGRRVHSLPGVQTPDRR